MFWLINKKKENNFNYITLFLEVFGFKKAESAKVDVIFSVSLCFLIRNLTHIS